MKRPVEYLYSVLSWTIAFVLFGFFRFYGMDELPDVEFRVPIYERMPWAAFLLMGMICGLVYEFIEQRAQSRKFLQDRPYWVTLLVKTIFYGMLAQITIVLVGVIANQTTFGAIDWTSIKSVARGKNFWVFFAFVSLVSFTLSVAQIIVQHFGWRVLVNLIMGKYYRPFEEYRIFMFLDMRDSTTIAEQLGTIQYSQFIQDCFRDFTPVIQEHLPEVYQYVGDEVVLTWLPQYGLKDFNCLHACFTFNNILQARSEYYLQQYGLVPTFKAGAHIGRVRVTEIGTLRRAIAYHGDVMNTTARIQSQCNTLGQLLLISEALWKELPRQQTDFEVETFEAVPLKGKEEAVNLVGVRIIEK